LGSLPNILINAAWIGTGRCFYVSHDGLILRPWCAHLKVGLIDHHTNRNRNAKDRKGLTYQNKNHLLLYLKIYEESEEKFAEEKPPSAARQALQ
jgi:hypothetical protein